MSKPAQPKTTPDTPQLWERLKGTLRRCRTRIKEAAHQCGHCLNIVLRTWRRGFWSHLTGPTGYRVIAVFVAAYVGLYSIFEARHERQLNYASTERNVFTSMVSSGERGSFIAAMKNFGPIQTIATYTEPSLISPLNWWNKMSPNLESLHLWAQYRLPLCTCDTCGDSESYRIDLQHANLRNSKLNNVNLDNGDLRFAELHYANLQSVQLKDANLACATMTDANLRNARLQDADLKLTNLSNSDLEGAILRGANLEGFNIFAVITGTFVADNKARQRSAAGVPLELTNCGRLNRNNLVNTNLKYADLRGVKNLNCERLKQANNWYLACRDLSLACDREVPEPGSSRCPIIE